MGAVHEWVDVDLLALVAKALPDCYFVLVGPVIRDLGPLRDLPNVQCLGQKPHHMIPKYVRHFDACVIPYILNAYTETAYPAKLNEYFALGKPVVATPLPELVDYNEEYGQVLYLAGDAQAFADQLKRIFRDMTPAMATRLKEVAELNAWSLRVEKMASLIEESFP